MKTEYQDTRHQLLVTGRAMMQARGFTAVGLSELLAAARVPKGSFYHYFKSKEQFGVELLHDYFDDYLAQQESQLAHAPGDGRSRLLGYFAQWLSDASGGGGQCDNSDGRCEVSCLVVKLSAEVADLSESMRAALAAGSGRIIAALATAIDAGRADGSLAAVDVGARQQAESLYGLWLGASLLTKLRREPSALEGAMRLTELQLAAPVR